MLGPRRKLAACQPADPALGSSGRCKLSIRYRALDCFVCKCHLNTVLNCEKKGDGEHSTNHTFDKGVISISYRDHWKATNRRMNGTEWVCFLVMFYRWPKEGTIAQHRHPEEKFRQKCSGDWLSRPSVLKPMGPFTVLLCLTQGPWALTLRVVKDQPGTAALEFSISNH